MTSLLTENLTDSICEQIAHERFNSTIYLYFCGYLRNKGLDNLAKHFRKQHDEEIEHSILFFDFLTAMNADVVIPEVPACDMSLNNILDVAKLYLEREIITTNSINDIKKLSIDENNPVAEEFLRGMISKQLQEYEEANSFNDRAEITGTNWMNVFVWDSSLG